MGKEKRASQKALINRYKFIFGVMLLFAMLIIGKLFKTTVVDASEWNKVAQMSLTDSVVIYPDRGNIYAADGSLLAANVRIYDVRIDFGSEAFRADTLKKYVKQLCDSVCAINMRLTPEEMEDKITDQLEKYESIEKENAKLEKSQRRKNRYRQFTLLRNCSNLDLKRLRSLKFFKTKGGKYTLVAEGKNRRLKPFGSMASQSIGSVSEKTIDNTTAVVRGVSGLERALDSLLYGKPGIGSSIQLTNGIRRWADVKPQRGYDIVTTIDVRMQDILETELYKRCEETKAEWGTAVLMEVATGEIKAISNLCLNEKTGKYSEGMNYAFRGFEPGSVVKPISMMIALEDRLVGLNEKIPTGRSFHYAKGKPISDAHAYTSLTPSEIIAYSSNIGMSKIILRGFERHPSDFKKRLQKIGMLDSLHLGIYGEQPPYIPNIGDENWDRISLTRICYGYATRIPPIYTLAMYNAIANGGRFVRPRLVKELWKDGVCDTVFPVSYVRDRICRPEVAAELCDMLKRVVWDPHGTGRLLQNNFVSLSGKTGTAYDIIKGQYDFSKKRLAFCGFFPSDAPKYSCVVLMSHANAGAARSSGMVMMNIALKMYARGMLGNVSDYRAEADNRSTPATFMAVNSEAEAELKSDLGIPSVRHFKRVQEAPGHVPSVIGMGLRQALRTLEVAGLNVSGFSGNGYVYRQSIAPGSKYNKGEKITLQLK